MSALPPKADVCSALAHVCFEPKADIGDTEFGVEAGTDLIDAANDHDRNTGGDQTVFGYLRSQFQN
jgi:hypothetical protein